MIKKNGPIKIFVDFSHQKKKMASEYEQTFMKTDSNITIHKLLSESKNIKFRRDDVSMQLTYKKNNSAYYLAGCIFIVEYSSNIHFVWAPYTLLSTISDKFVTHVNSSGEVLTKEQTLQKDLEEKKKQIYMGTLSRQNDSEYVSAVISPKSKPQIRNSSEKHSIVLLLDEIKSLKKSIPTMGWSSLIVSDYKCSYPPLYFQDGGLIELLDLLKKYVDLQK